MSTQAEFPRTRGADAIGFDLLREPPDFSLVLGGPIFQLYRKSHLTGASLELLHRRLLVIAGIAWLPLLLLSLMGPSPASLGQFSFVRDIEVHVRLLMALPVLIATELVVHSRLRLVVRAFVDRRIVQIEDFDRFSNAISSALRLRNSIPLECGLIVLVYTVGLWLWQDRIAIANPTWYAMPGGHWNLTEVQQVVEEAVFIVPHLVVGVANPVHRVRDPEEMLQKPESNVFVDRVVLGEDKSDLQHILAIEGHPCRSIGLVQVAPGWQRSTAVEYPDIVEPKESAGEDILA